MMFTIRCPGLNSGAPMALQSVTLEGGGEISVDRLNALANGDICSAIGYSGDILQASERAEEAKNGHNIVLSLPKEGAQMWFDQMAIPADAKNVEEAHAFLNYIMKPDVMAKASNYLSRERQPRLAVSFG